jgi:hypothetical protein
MDQTAGAADRDRRHEAHPDRCANCAARLAGPWCHSCGQSATDLHRSLSHLIREALEHAFDADGRVWRTLPRLLLRPAALTRDYLAGRRASQTPPLRLFLAALLLVFVTSEWSSEHGHIQMMQIETAPNDWIDTFSVHVWQPWDAALTDWLRSHLAAALAHPDRLRSGMARWAHDCAFLTLPIAALLLSVMFAFRREFVVFDHFIFSMHSLSFFGLAYASAVLLQALLGDAALLLVLVVPVHLFAHLKGVYRLSAIGALVRTVVLGVTAAGAFGLIIAALFVAGLASLEP